MTVKTILDLLSIVSTMEYRTRAIITRGLYFFYPIFHCGLYSRAVYAAERLVLPDSFFICSLTALQIHTVEVQWKCSETTVILKKYSGLQLTMLHCIFYQLKILALFYM